MIFLKKNKFFILHIIARIFLFLFICILIYTFYRAEIVFKGSKDSIYLKYYFISLFSIIFWTVVIFYYSKYLEHLTLICLSTLFSLMVVEFFLLFTDLAPSPSEYRINKITALGKKFDNRSTLEVINNFKLQGIETVPNFISSDIIASNGLPSYNNEKIFPLGSVSDSETVFCNENGTYITVKKDKYGFINNNNIYNQASIDVALIGDSFTAGVCVPPINNIAGQIEYNSDLSVLNVGIPSAGPLIELAAFNEYVMPLKPKKVIWIYYEGNDLNINLEYEKSSSTLMKYLDKGFSQNLLSRQKEIDDTLIKYISLQEEKFKESIKSNKLKDIFKFLRLQNIRRFIGSDVYCIDASTCNVPYSIAVVDPLFQDILKQVRSAVNEWGGDLYFFYLPTYSRYSNNIEDNNTYLNRQGVLKIVEDLEIPIIDMHNEIFLNEKDPLELYYFGLPGHLNEKGYYKAAKEIINNL